MIELANPFAALSWQVELGADEAIQDKPVNRFELAARPTAKAPVKLGPTSNLAPLEGTAVIPHVTQTAPEIAQLMAEGCATLQALQNAISTFEHCALKKGARNLVFADGNTDARVMIIGEAPGRDEDLQGKPFVGRAGQLLDKMFAAIGLARDGTGAGALYITNVMPWRPPQNRDPDPEEIAMMLPFLKRHIELVEPDFLILMGNTACKAVLGQSGITRIRGTWTEAFGRPALPMFHPAALLRDGLKKRDAWADLLSAQERLDA